MTVKNLMLVALKEFKHNYEWMLKMKKNATVNTGSTDIEVTINKIGRLYSKLSFYFNKPVILIDAFEVVESQRKHGYGKIMMDKLFDTIRESKAYPKTVIVAPSSGVIAKKDLYTIYLHLGFEFANEHNEGYSRYNLPNEYNIFMIKEL